VTLDFCSSIQGSLRRKVTPITETGLRHWDCIVLLMTLSHAGWLYFSGTLDQWVAKQAKLGRKFEISSSSDENRHSCDDWGKEVAVEYDFLDPTCCQYDPAFKLPE
jgi:hypothetical protein